MRPTAKSITPDKPSWLTAQAAEVWSDTLKALSDLPELLCRVDGPLLATYCESWDTYLQADAIVRSDGLLAKSSNGVPFQHPAVGIRNKARNEILRIGAKFGLSPGDRKKLGVLTTDDDDDPAAEYVR